MFGLAFAVADVVQQLAVDSASPQRTTETIFSMFATCVRRKRLVSDSSSEAEG
jgi:hypothetical protein